MSATADDRCLAARAVVVDLYSENALVTTRAQRDKENPRDRGTRTTVKTENGLHSCVRNVGEGDGHRHIVAQRLRLEPQQRLRKPGHQHCRPVMSFALCLS